ncbi:Cysteine protease ATG4B [Camponotus floridanus]|uniref:Cysteine protease n=1 Tax=Camponotus floridanus TaxID=104421 RepID=E1ZVV5_CAMFO|nr:Cysteine protease ATG4B [Camponotus floridanus]
MLNKIGEHFWTFPCKDWQWMPETKNSTYLKILSRFEDKRAAAFSIHQIALMGASEGKEVGQWFGPNTIAQVLKKLVVYDEWSSITIHVALDNTLIINDICKYAVISKSPLSKLSK